MLIIDILTKLRHPELTGFVIAGKQQSNTMALRQIVANRVFPMASRPLGILMALGISVRNVVNIVEWLKKETITGHQEHACIPRFASVMDRYHTSHYIHL
jgi:hypothetical protein